MNELALCAGVGGMSLGLGLVLGEPHGVACFVERERYAAEILAARMEEGNLPIAPIWSDLETFDGRLCRDIAPLIVTSGLPCQPYSVAGKQLADADERALWPHLVRIVEESEAAMVFIENVPGFRKHFASVWIRLRELGFEWAPPLLSTASQSGAPHIRQRFFALAAHPERIDIREQPGRIGGASRTGPTGTQLSGPTDSRADGERRESEWCGWVFDGERETLGHDADRCGDGCRIRGTLWDAQSPPVRVDAGAPDRVDELRAIGNVGCPPVVYASAFITLAQHLEGPR